VVDALAAELSKDVPDEFLGDAPAPVLGMDYEMIDMPAVVGFTGGIERNQTKYDTVVFGDIDRSPEMPVAGQPVLPEGESGIEDLFFLAEALIGNRSVLVAKERPDLGSVGEEKWLDLDHL